MNEIEQLEEQAIDAAINLSWDDAVELNEKILKKDKNNYPAYLRLGFIYLQKHNYELAKKYYSKALKIQPKNTVAIQNLEKIEILEKSRKKRYQTGRRDKIDPELFIEVVGKTKKVGLVNIGQKDIIAGLSIGQKIDLKIKRRRVEIRTPDTNLYIGTLPDDVSKRLIYFIQAKSLYNTFIKEVTINSVTVFIKELKKGPTVKHYISFPLHNSGEMKHMLNSNGNDEEKGGNDHSINIDEDESDELWEKIVEQHPKDEFIDIQTEEDDDLSEE